MKVHTLQDESELFQVSVGEAGENYLAVFFAAGAGGDPERYVTLLDAMLETRCKVVAPHFQRLLSSTLSEAELTLRARRMQLQLALNAFAQPDETIVGVGHSIGASILLALSGGRMWLRAGQHVPIEADGRLAKLALLAPPTGFFQAPSSLCSVRIPIDVWVGSADDITPPSESKWLARELQGRQAVNIHTINSAGHFSFMDKTPPNTIEPIQGRQAFLREYSSAICRFLHGEQVV